MNKPNARNKAVTLPSPSAAVAVTGELIDMDQAIALLKTTRPTFYRWLRAGKIKSMKVGRQWRFYRADIERFLQGAEPRVEVTGNLAGFLTELDHKLKAYNIKLPAPAPDQMLPEAINRMIELAFAARASDVHLQPPSGGDDGKALLRHRIDGTLHEVMRFDARLLPAIIDRLKTMAGCDLTQKKRPQDGRITLKIKQQEADIRVNFLPAVMGEAATLCILRRDGLSFKLDQLPYAPADMERIRQVLRMPWGLVLFTGPTGSGKTTSLYAALCQVNTPEQKVMTVEDPVEYTFPGMVQVQVNPRENLTFAAVLRAFMRSDPDVMMVGEVRDRETMQGCAQAALTGHLVLTSLHTDEAASALARMIDIGLDPFVVADAVKLVVSQRLVRSLCKHCSVPIEPAADQLAQAERLAKEGGLPWDKLPKQFRKPVGCQECGFTGYRGRTLAAETMVMSPALGEAIRKGAGVPELRRIAVMHGMTTITADALSRAAEGQTSLDEALRLSL